MSNPSWRNAQELDGAFTLALLYVALPCLIFLLGFIRPAWGWPLATALAFALWQAAAPLRWQPNLRSYAGPALLAALLVAVVGIHSGHAAYDWIKHWALINEIAKNDWPVQVELHGEQKYLRFYLAAYLVPALLHKATGLAIPLATAAWYFLGFTLLFRLLAGGVARRAAGYGLAAIVLVLMLCGADALAEHALRAVVDQGYPAWLGVHYESWASQLLRVPLQFPSALTSLAWVPHQAIPVCVAAAMVAMDHGQQRLPRLVLVYGLMALWSPYGMIGLLPLVLYRTLPAWREIVAMPVAAAVVAGAAFALLCIAYLATEMPQAGMCASCVGQNAMEFTSYVPFLLVELLPFALILRGKLLRDPCSALACATLLAIPLLHGETLDFVARGAAGPLFVLALRSAQALLAESTLRWQHGLAAAALALCLPTTVSELVYHAGNGQGQRIADQRKPESGRWASKFSRSGDIRAAEFLDECGWYYESQYFIASKPTVLK